MRWSLAWGRIKELALSSKEFRPIAGSATIALELYLRDLYHTIIRLLLIPLRWHLVWVPSWDNDIGWYICRHRVMILMPLPGRWPVSAESVTHLHLRCVRTIICYLYHLRWQLLINRSDSLVLSRLIEVIHFIARFGYQTVKFLFDMEIVKFWGLRSIGVGKWGLFKKSVVAWLYIHCSGWFRIWICHINDYISLHLLITC